MLNTSASGELYHQALTRIPDGVSSSMRKNVTPVLYFERADGPFFFDADDNKYVDYTLAWGPLIVGSNHPVINEAVSKQLTRGYTFGAQHRLEIELADYMVSVLPGVEQVLFCNTGSEAVQGAIRIARTKTGRKKIVKFEGHYHGWLNNVLVSYKPSETDLGIPSPTCGGQPPSEYADTLVAPWNDLHVLEELFSKNPGQIACVLTEPILANSGCCMPTEGYLQGVIDLCEKYGAVSVFDEVITGFRIALGGARAYFNVVPDMTVYAKAIAGGFTMAAIGGKAEMFDVLRSRETIHAGTYNGSPINLAAAVATLNILSHPTVYSVMHRQGEEIRRCLHEEALRHDIVLVTSGVGTVFSVHFGLRNPPSNYADTLLSDKAMYEKFRVGMLHEGILLLPDGRWYMGAAHSEETCASTKSAIVKVLANLTIG